LSSWESQSVSLGLFSLTALHQYGKWNLPSREKSRMVHPSFLAFDLGAASGRAVLGSLENKRLKIKEISRFPNTMLSIHGHLYWNIYRLFEEIQKGLAACAGEARIQGIALDTWGVDFGVLAEDGTILGLPHAYRDPHTQGMMEEFFKKVPKERIYELTGIQFMPFNSLFQLFTLERSESSSLKNAHDLLFMPDLFNYLLTGEKKTEFTMATTSQMYNPRKAGWEGELFDALGISKSLMEEVIQPGTVIGNLIHEISQPLGWEAVPVIAVATHDTGSAVAAVPAQGQDWAYISSGTWSLLGVETRDPIINDQAMDLNFTNEGGIEGTFRFLKNITGLWLLQECRKAWATKHEYSFEELNSLALEAKPFQCFIDPDWEGFLCPPHMPETIQAFCTSTGQAVPETPAELVRCIFESLALKYRMVLDQLAKISPHPIRKIHVIGGGANNPLLSQFTANASGLPVYAGPSEATSIGNIMMQAFTQGYFQTLREMREVILHSFKVTAFKPFQGKDWENAYGRFREIVRRDP
jgi:rhamnulokinase